MNEMDKDAALAQLSSIVPTSTEFALRQHEQAAKGRRCSCKNSRCLKMYCDCFASGVYCVPGHCVCSDCNNKEEFEKVRKIAVAGMLRKNPLAFRPKVERNRAQSGCNCRKSSCLKKYCECLIGGVYCGRHCRCVNCKNYEGFDAQSEHSGPARRKNESTHATSRVTKRLKLSQFEVLSMVTHSTDANKDAPPRWSETQAQQIHPVLLQCEKFAPLAGQVSQRSIEQFTLDSTHDLRKLRLKYLTDTLLLGGREKPTPELETASSTGDDVLLCGEEFGEEEIEPVMPPGEEISKSLAELEQQGGELDVEKPHLTLFEAQENVVLQNLLHHLREMVKSSGM